MNTLRTHGSVEVTEPFLLTGAKNPSTLSTMNDLAALYDVMGLFAKAEPLYVESLRGHQEVMGEKDPSTLATMSNLARMYDNQV